MDKNNFTKKDRKYIRVGTDYFKIIEKPDRFDIIRTELKKWSKETIKDDHPNKYFLDSIPKYDDFIITPNNNGVSKVIHNCYNMYSAFPHKPKKGKWKWTEILLRHIFGSQYEQGLIYLQVLYLFPKQPLPILVLVSEERQTGKSTFLDWLNMVFGANMAMIEPDVIGNNFNGEYATSNIIAIDEGIIDKQIAIEKIKSLSTKKFISVNIKQVAHFKLPFFGKIIMASNNEDKFMRVDQSEIRFWVRKILTPTQENHNILNDMIEEIPSFLSMIKDLPPIDFTKSRMVLTAEQINNDYLKAVVAESHSGLFKEISELFQFYFENGCNKECYATPKDIKEKFFANDKSISINYIRKVLKSEFKFENTKSAARYSPFNSFDNIVGKPFTFKASDFTDKIITDDDNKPPF